MLQNSVGSGLQNLGNTCFFNATLQSLLYAPPLAFLFQKQRHSQNCSRHGWCVYCEMERIYNSSRVNRIFSPLSMIKNLNKIFKKFRLGRQEDSHQFLRYLIEGMQQSQTGKLGKDREDNQNKIKKTTIFDIFGGIMKTSVECLSCHRNSITAQRYYDFNIECQRGNSLHEGLTNFFATDKLQGYNKYLCEHCKVRVNARKYFRLESVPQIATFQLKRFTNTMRKYLEKPTKTVLKLFAIIVHLGGSSFSGHYYAYVRSGNLWYKMDDSYVSKVSVQTVMNQQAYILFYQRQEQVHKHQKSQFIVEQSTKKIEEKQEQKKEYIKEKEEVEIKMNGKHKKKEQKMDNQKDEKIHMNEPTLKELQDLLVNRLTDSGLFKENGQSQQLNSTICKVVKQAILEVSPKRQNHNNNQEEDIKKDKEEDKNEELIELPRLRRRKSKEQMEHELPYYDLVLRTMERILDLRMKVSHTRPRNFSKRSIYNLRNYESQMQKKRKLG